MSDLIVSRQSMMTPEAMMPAMALSAAKERHDAMIRFVAEAMERDRDYGVIPGTNQKPVLLKPGAEKLKTFFGLTNRFPLVEKTEDWMGVDHGGEPFFYYWYNCQLWRGDYLIAEAEGSANSWEKKYRYRQSERVCPLCGQTAIIKGKTEYGGGWLCWAKKGGCGAKFAEGDVSIEGQEVGRVPNPDVFDQVNTIQKMAQKRALIAAVLIGVNASEFFTQDIEDFEDGSGEPPATTKREVLRRTADRVVEPKTTEQEQRDNAPPANTPKNGLYKPEPSAPQKETPAFPAGHWIKRVDARSAFWAYTSKLGLSNEEVHEALGVQHVEEFPGTMQEAKTRIEQWVELQQQVTDLEQEEEEGQQHPPVEELSC